MTRGLWVGCLLVFASISASAEEPQAAPEPATTTAAVPATATPAAPAPVVVPSTPVIVKDKPVKRRDAQTLTEEGLYLPGTVSARIGDQRVSAFAWGGYDTNSSQGGVFSGVIEGAIVNRIAIRVGYDFLQAQSGSSLSAGLRLGILRQEINGVDLGFFVQYKQKGFSESNGEIELAITVARRWGKFGLFGEVVYGQGFERQERDGEVRLAGLYSFKRRYNLGFEARSHFDLGDASGPPLAGSPPEASFDLIVGPLASISLGPVALLAEAGFHTLVLDTGNDDDVTSTGFIALAGAGAAF